MNMKRIIFHIDVNNAFLSWSAINYLKQGSNIDIRTIPSIIAGDESKRRGVVLAKSPIAKKYGIKTAETIYTAKKKCQHLKIFPPNFEWYKKESANMYKYLCQYTPIIQRYSIDECFIDLTGTKYIYKDYLSLAYKIKNDIKNKFGFTVNIGIGNNKLCAKMASDFEKPDKVHTLYNNEIKTKMWPLPIEDLLMVGKKTAEKMRSLNINKIGDLANTDINLLKKYFKNQAQVYKNYALGIDDSKVESIKPKAKSISITETLPYDYNDKLKLQHVLLKQTEEISRILREKKEYTQTIAVTYKNKNFEKYSHQIKLDTPINKTEEIYDTIIDIFNQSWKEDPIRNIGIRLSDFTNIKKTQISLFDNQIEYNKSKEENIQHIIDHINNKYGSSSILKASYKITENEDIDI